jgi:hypothetical protein
LAEPATGLVILALRHLAALGLVPRGLSTRPLDGATEIDSLGMDSLSKLNFLSEIEERADHRVDERNLVGVRTLADLARLLEKR